MRKLAILLTGLIMLTTFSATSKELKFAVVPKFNSVFFDQSKYGCEDGAKELANVSCIYVGPNQADVRTQDQIIQKLIDEGVDGIAVAVAQSQFLADHSMQKAKDAGVPIVTYDSDFEPSILKEYGKLRLAYIGTNNFELGKALGEQLKVQRPVGGTLIIQSGRPDSPNLNLRIMGIRSALSGKQYATPPGDILNNDNGWTEAREPYFNYDQIPRAVKQLEQVIVGKWPHVNSFTSVGGWTQNDEGVYKSVVSPYKQKLTDKEMVIVVSDASATQLQLLQDKLATANVGQSPYEMGRQAILTLYKIVNGEQYDEIIYTPLNVCTQQNYDTCTKK